MKIERKHLFGIGFGILIIIAGILFFRKDIKILYFIVVFGIIAGLLPILASFIINLNRQKELDSKFLEFARDLVENVKSGTPVSKSIVNLRKRNYGHLSLYIEKLANQLLLGIPLTIALSNFARDTNSRVISRAVGLISEAERSGGRIDTIIESVARSVNQTEILKKERKSAVYNLVVQGYIIFMVFIVIMLVLEFKILPMTAEMASSEQGLSISVRQIGKEQFSMPLLILILTQSFFSGLVIGKISEGSIKNGIKHSFILIALTLLVITGARAFLG